MDVDYETIAKGKAREIVEQNGGTNLDKTDEFLCVYDNDGQIMSLA